MAGVLRTQQVVYPDEQHANDVILLALAQSELQKGDRVVKVVHAASSLPQAC